MIKRLAILLLVLTMPLCAISQEELLKDEIKKLKGVIRELVDRIELLELSSEINSDSEGTEDAAPANTYTEQWYYNASNNYAVLEYSTAVTAWVVNPDSTNGLVYQVWQVSQYTNRIFDWVRAH